MQLQSLSLDGFFWGGVSHSPAFLQASFLFCGLAPQPLLLTRTKGTVVGEKSHPAVFRNWEILLLHSSEFSRFQESLG